MSSPQPAQPQPQPPPLQAITPRPYAQEDVLERLVRWGKPALLLTAGFILGLITASVSIRSHERVGNRAAPSAAERDATVASLGVVAGRAMEAAQSDARRNKEVALNAMTDQVVLASVLGAVQKAPVLAEMMATREFRERFRFPGMQPCDAFREFGGRWFLEEVVKQRAAPESMLAPLRRMVGQDTPRVD